MRTGRPSEQIHREIYLFRFLARVFIDPDSPWVLKGGGGLLVRISDGARYSRDADLMRMDVPAAEAVVELEALLNRPTNLDPLIFQVKRSKSDPGALDVAQLSAEVYYEPKRLHTFPIDLSIRSTLAAGADHVVPTSIIDIDGFAELPAFKVMSLADQIGDKVAAMYQLYGPMNTSVSTRYHDLVDLHLIITRFPVDAASTVAALLLQQSRRDNLTLPSAVRSPAPSGTPAIEPRRATLSSIHGGTRSMMPLAALAGFLDPLLNGTRTTGRWNPLPQRWSEL